MWGGEVSLKELYPLVAKIKSNDLGEEWSGNREGANSYNNLK